MKKKIMMLSCIAACAFVSGYVGMKACESHAYESNSLLMQNVEALTQNGEDNGEMPPPEDGLVICYGPKWRDSLIRAGKVTAREHDSEKDTLDNYVVYPVSKCCASHEGAGIIRGNNIDMNYGYPIKRIPIPCEGDKFHIRIEDIMGDYFEKSDPYGEL